MKSLRFNDFVEYSGIDRKLINAVKKNRQVLIGVSSKTIWKMSLIAHAVLLVVLVVLFIIQKRPSFGEKTEN